MKAIVLGLAGVALTGTVAVVGTGSSGPDDFVGTVNRPTAQVYAAFASMSREGYTAMPERGGWGARYMQRVTKVANERLLWEVMADQQTIASVDIRFAPEGEGTRVAAEFDIHQAPASASMDAGAEDGGPAMLLSLGETAIDMMLAQAMAGMMVDVEAGRPLPTLASSLAGWRPRDAASPNSTPNQAIMEQRQATRQAVRPMVDPNEVARAHRAGRQPNGAGGW